MGSHPPVGYQLANSDTSNVPGYRGLGFHPPTSGNPHYSIGSRVQFHLQAVGSQVLVRVDAFATWVHGRTAAQSIPADALQATVELFAGPPPITIIASEVVGAVEAQRLASELNASIVTPSKNEWESCVESFNAWEIRFEYADQDRTAVACYTSACGNLMLTVNGKPEPESVATQGLSAEVYSDAR